MSNLGSWTKRMESYRYSQDDRMLTYKFEKELEPAFDQFVAMQVQKSMVLGPYDLSKEPWRYAAVQSMARKYAFKVTEKETGNTVEYVISKQKLSMQNLH